MRHAILTLLIFFRIFAELSVENLLPTHNSNCAYTPAVAHGDGIFLVCWQSGRLLDGDLRNGPIYHSKIVACRIDINGTIIDNEPFIISSHDDLREAPKVVFNGSDFVAVWQDLRNGTDWDIYAARITKAGTVLDPDGILVSGGARNQIMPEAVYDGTNVNIVWLDGRSSRNYEVYLTRLSPDGSILEPNGIIAATGNTHYVSPVIATADEGKVFVFSTGSQYRFASTAPQTLSPTVGSFFLNGQIFTKDVYSTTNDPYDRTVPVAIASGNGNFFVAWQNEINTGGRANAGSNNAAILSSLGERFKNMSVGFIKSGTINRMVAPKISWDGEGFVLVWHEFYGNPNYEKVCLAKFNVDGDTIISPVLVSGTANSPSAKSFIASNTANKASLIVYEKHPSVSTEPIVIGYRLLNDGVTKTENSVSQTSVPSMIITPNPFNPIVNITVNNFSGIKNTLTIHNLQGKVVANLTKLLCEDNQKISATWDAFKNPSGMYIVNYKNETTTIRKRINLIK